MKIVQILPYSYTIHPWGLEKVAQTLSHGLAKIPWYECIDVASNIGKWENQNSDSGLVKNIYISSIEIVSGFPCPKFWTKDYWNIMKKISDSKPDAIITHTRFFLQSMTWWLMAKYIWCKRVHIEHGSWFVTGYPWYIKLCAWLFDWTIWLWIFRQCDQIITISHMHKNFIKRFTKKEPIVIYNPVDYIPQQRLPNKTGIIHIWFVGRLVPLKWVDILLYALSQLETKNRKCVIVWDGSEKQKLIELTSTLWLDDKVCFVWSDDRNNRLHRFDIFVNPSYQEWVPTTVIEALLAGCIVVATDVWWTREITDKEDLILCEPGDKDILSSTISKAIQSTNFSKKSYKFIQDKHNIDNVIMIYKRYI